jgi:hypothetical protein
MQKCPSATHQRICIGTGWDNTEFRSYKFWSDTDEGASLVETAESLERRNLAKLLTNDEQRQLKATAEKQWAANGFSGSQQMKL